MRAINKNVGALTVDVRQIEVYHLFYHFHMKRIYCIVRLSKEYDFFSIELLFDE